MRSLRARVRTAPDEVAERVQRLRGERFASKHADPSWAPYAGLASTSWTLTCVRPDSTTDPCISLLLPTIGPHSMFAGVRTALETASYLAKTTGRPLRVLSFASRLRLADGQWLNEFVRAEFGYDGPTVPLVSGWALRDLRVSAREIWIATYWSLAHAVDVASRMGIINADRVCYLVQDYEPSFFAGSTESALAQSTYHAGFRMLVNSSPVKRELAAREGIEVAPDHVFRPALDLPRLEQVANRRRPRSTLRVGFYGRPSKPRNSFALGVSALRHAAQQLASEDVTATFLSMGEPHRAVDLGAGARLRPLGKLTWVSYFSALSEVDVLLSLQQSPHPSHPPLEAVASGGFAVTNDIGTTRQRLSDHLIAVPNDPAQLGAAVVEAGLSALRQPARRAVDLDFLSHLGRPLHEVIDAYLNDIGDGGLE